MLLRQMKYFVAIVEQDSFTKAAEEMYISQSAISQQMQILEKELGTQLFIRKKRSFILTPAGEYFYSQAKIILWECKLLKNKVKEIGSTESGETKLRIGYLSSYSGQELFKAVAEFSETYPDVPIDIVSGTHEELYHGMLDGKIDMAINDQRRAFSDEFVNFEMLRCDCYIEISKLSELSDRDSVDIEELHKIPCILISSKEQQTAEADYYRNVIGYKSQFIFAENIEDGKLMTVGNRGFLPIESFKTLSFLNSAVKRIPLYRKGKPIRRNYCVFWLKEHENYYIEEFGNILHRSFHQKKP